MPGIDQVLSIIVQQGANELRLGSDEEPAAFALGARRRFTMAATTDAVLRQLLGDIFSSDRESRLAEHGRIAFDYEARDIGLFQVFLSKRPNGGLDVKFILAASSTHKVTQEVPLDSGQAHATQFPQLRRHATPSMVAPIEPVPTATPVDGQQLPRLAALVERAIALRASDLHLADDEVPVFRVDGQLRRESPDALDSVAKLFALDAEGLRQLAAGRALEFTTDITSLQRLRVSICRTHSGLAAAVRLLPRTAPSLKELHLPASLQGLSELPHGLVLICGATGSGKSTTLAALLRHAIEQRSIVVVTLEDPIEFGLPLSPRSVVRQRQLGRDVQSFDSGLREALRSDPDVIMVGELRDPETIRLAMTAAETGHLVLASLHSGSAASCVERLIDAYPAEQRSQIRVQLADALRSVVVQRLVPRAHGTGRIPALEVLLNTRGVANVIREGKTAQLGTMLQSGKREGMLLLERCLADYVQSGLITAEAARAAANDADSLAMYLVK